MFAGRLSVSGHGAQDDRCCGVRQNRVVLASVADVKLSVANLIQPDRSTIKPAAMEAKGIRLQGELGISRQTIAQGMPACSGCNLYARVRISHQHCTRDRGCSKHPAFPAPSHLGEKEFQQTSGAMRREIANVHLNDGGARKSCSSDGAGRNPGAVSLRSRNPGLRCAPSGLHG